MSNLGIFTKKGSKRKIVLAFYSSTFLQRENSITNVAKLNRCNDEIKVAKYTIFCFLIKLESSILVNVETR